MTSLSPTAWEIADGVFRRWWLLALGLVLGGGVAVAATLAVPTSFIASTSVVVELPAQDSADTEAVIRTVQSLLTSDVLMRDVARGSRSGLSGPAVADRISVERSSGSGVIDVLVRDGDRDRAVTIADAVLPSLESRLTRAQIADRTATGTRVSTSIKVDTLGLATAQPAPVPTQRNGVLGAVGGLGLFVLLAIWRTVASIRRVERQRESHD